ncbi:MAG TPA: hypothetical protein PKG49_11190 [Nitrosomonas mobilis]|nr:hypothetical protein [Nitrosomonas mobilis]
MTEFINLLESVPSVVWTGIVGTLIGSSLTIIGVVLTNRSNTERLKTQLQHEQNIRRQELKRERVEELYIESKKYLNAVGIHYLPYKKVMEGELTFNQALDLNIGNGSKRDFEPHRVTMIIDMYFPNLQKPFNEIMAKRDFLNRIVTGYKEQYKTGGTDGSRWLEPFQAKLEELSEAITAFEKLVASLEIEE